MLSFLTVVFVLIVPNALCASIEGRAGYLNHDNETVCYGKLGCLVTTDEWYNVLHRPINLTPGSRADINTTFTLYTRENMEGEIISVSENDEVSSDIYKAEAKTKFITHGFLSNGKADWVMDIMKALLSRMDINVVTVDWSKGSTFPYTQAVSNTRVVGLEIAYLVNTLIKCRGVSADNFHLIGHSLGAQASGYAGERIEGLGRITGLDPAGPMFTGMPTFVRLDSSDAKFVDVIHTNTDLLGIKETSGHVDFYPNGGGSQPGCIVSLRMGLAEAIAAFEEGPSCSHSRSEELFIESITSSPYVEDEGDDHKCPLIAFLCESYEDFINGMCTSCGEDGMGCALMGLDADKYPGKDNLSEEPKNFYMKTNSNSPFCGFHYAANLTVASNSKGREHQAGKLYIDAYGDEGVASKMDLTENGPRKMTKGDSYNFLGFSPSNSGKVSRVDVTWKWKPSLMSLDTCVFCVKDLFLSNLEVTNLGYYPGEKFQTSALCSDENPTVIKNGSPTPLNLKC